jgi:hypothetical protein
MVVGMWCGWWLVHISVAAAAAAGQTIIVVVGSIEVPHTSLQSDFLRLEL